MAQLISSKGKDAMRKLLTFLIALGAIVFGVCSPAAAQYGGCLGACGTVASALPGPPTATFQSQVAGSNSSSTVTATVATGSSFSTRIVVAVIAGFTNSVAFTLTGATLDGNAALNFGTVISGPGSGADAGVWYAVFADSAGTTSSSLVATFNTSVSGNFRVATYTMDSSQMAGTTPATFSGSSATNATSISANLTIANNGSVVIAQDSSVNETKTYTGVTMTSDSSFNVTKLAHANSVSSGAPTLTESWATGSNNGVLGVLVFR
jgi:hypothetical protein